MLRIIGDLLSSFGRALASFGAMFRPVIDPMIYIYRRGWSFQRRYGRALRALVLDRSSLLLRFELGFLPSLTSWTRPDFPNVYCWSIDRWQFDLNQQRGILGQIAPRNLISSIAIHRPPMGSSLWRYRPHDIIENLTHYSRLSGIREEIKAPIAKVVGINDTFYGNFPVLVFHFEGALDESSREIQVPDQVGSELST